jgi:hypothetical protein
MEVTNPEAFHARLKGTFYGMLQWQQLDELWGRVKRGQWFVYQVGEEAPSAPLNGSELAERIDALDMLLREEHDYHLCGIVYADHVEEPTLIRSTTPLGSACSRNYPHAARWILSLRPPHRNAVPVPNNRKRWWQLF